MKRVAAASACLVAVLLLPGAGAAQAPEPVVEPWYELAFLGVVVHPGESRRVTWAISESFAGAVLDTPVFVVRGTAPGPTLCLTAGIHGDELNGIEIVRRSLESVDPQSLHGTLVGVPIVNLHGFRRSSRYLPDRRDLNRYFPGRPGGSSAARIAHAFFEAVVRSCDSLVDLHTGSFHRANMPHVRANLDDPNAFEMAQAFGTSIIVHSLGTAGTLRRAATESGIPAITYEAGEPMRFKLDDVERGTQGIRNLLRGRGMIDAGRRRRALEVFRRSHWVRSDDGGILISEVELGDRVETGDLLGTVTDPLSNDRAELHAPHAGTVIGMALNQVVIPGFAAFHLGMREEDLAVPPGEERDWTVEAVEDTVGEGDERPE